MNVYIFTMIDQSMKRFHGDDMVDAIKNFQNTHGALSIKLVIKIELYR